MPLIKFYIKRYIGGNTVKTFDKSENMERFFFSRPLLNLISFLKSKCIVEILLHLFIDYKRKVTLYKQPAVKQAGCTLYDINKSNGAHRH